MKAWLLKAISDLNKERNPLCLEEVLLPEPQPKEVLIKVVCCGVCHTELDEIEGRTPPPAFPVVPGHQVIGRITKCGEEAKKYKEGDRVGVAWIFSSCGQCEFCISGLENLCADFKATGRDANGGYAEFIVANEDFVYPIPPVFTDAEAAPLLCAGAIGYRSIKLSGLKDGQVLGLTGFGASGHLVLKTAQYLYPKSKILVFARSKEEQEFAVQLGAYWAGNVTDKPDTLANAIIDTTPVWNTVVASLLHLKPGGRLIINAIRKESAGQEALLSMNYHTHLWMEKELKTVANIARADVESFLALAAKIPIKPTVEIYPFDKANEALVDLKHKHVRGAKVLAVNSDQ